MKTCIDIAVQDFLQKPDELMELYRRSCVDQVQLYVGGITYTAKLEELAAVTSTTYVLGDGVHPTYAGHELISREVYRVYRNLL